MSLKFCVRRNVTPVKICENQSMFGPTKIIVPHFMNYMRYLLLCQRWRDLKHILQGKVDIFEDCINHTLKVVQFVQLDKILVLDPMYGRPWFSERSVNSFISLTSAPRLQSTR
jgi:hypothetical protein